MKKSRRVKSWQIFGILLCVTALVCIAICIIQDRKNSWLLPAALLCNSLFCSISFQNEEKGINPGAFSRIKGRRHFEAKRRLLFLCFFSFPDR